MVRSWIMSGIVLLLVSPANAGEPLTLTTEKDRINYAIGVNVMWNLKQQGIDTDLDMVYRGMKDVQMGNKLQLSDNDIRKTMATMQSAVKQQRMKALSASGPEHRNEGEAFLAANAKKEGVQVLPSGLQYKILKSNDGKKPVDSDTVVCRYRGTLVNGTEFDSSDRTGKPATLKVDGVIAGWKEALKLMPVGSKWQLFVPPALAYGEKGVPGAIGPNAALMFEIELLAIK